MQIKFCFLLAWTVKPYLLWSVGCAHWLAYIAHKVNHVGDEIKRECKKRQPCRYGIHCSSTGAGGRYPMYQNIWCAIVSQQLACQRAWRVAVMGEGDVGLNTPWKCFVQCHWWPTCTCGPCPHGIGESFGGLKFPGWGQFYKKKKLTYENYSYVVVTADNGIVTHIKAVMAMKEDEVCLL